MPTLRDLRRSVASSPNDGTVSINRSPSGEEERIALANPDEDEASGARPYNEDSAKLRIDVLARFLAVAWSLFLSYLILCQGLGESIIPKVDGRYIYFESHRFHLDRAEFIAVVTTTTVSVFGFLVIVANYLFRRQASSGKS